MLEFRHFRPIFDATPMISRLLGHLTCIIFDSGPSREFNKTEEQSARQELL